MINPFPPASIVMSNSASNSISSGSTWTVTAPLLLCALSIVLLLGNTLLLALLLRLGGHRFGPALPAR